MEKVAYEAPKIEQIDLDKNISLALESAPPEGPEESFLIVNNYIDSNPKLFTI